MIEKVLPSGEKVTAFPLSIPQQLMFYMAIQYGSGYPINNIGSGYYRKGEFDREIMKQSIYEAISRCDTMRLRFIPDEDYKVLQYVKEKSELVIEEMDFSDLTPEEAEEKLTEISRGEIPMFYSELHRIALVRLPEGYNGIFMKLQHLAMDAYAVKVFLSDIIEIYLHKTKNAPYPKPMRPYIPTLIKELEYTDSEQHKADRQYWFDSLAKTTEPIFTDFMLDNRLKKQQLTHPEHRFADIHSGSPEAGILKFQLDGEKSRKIMEVCNEKGLSVAAAVSFAMRTALSVFNDNQQDVSFKTIVNRRGTINEKKSGGLRLNYLPLRTIISPEKTFCEAVEIVSEAQNEMYLHSSLSFLEMLLLRHESMPSDAKADSTYDSLGLSYQPLMTLPSIDGEGEKAAKSVWYNNGACMLPLYITVRHRAEDRGFEFIFEYRKDPDPVYDLGVFYKKLSQTLVLCSENPEITVGEILEKIALTKEERMKK